MFKFTIDLMMDAARASQNVGKTVDLVLGHFKPVHSSHPVSLICILILIACESKYSLP